MLVRLLTHTPDPEALVATAARVCLSSTFPKAVRGKNKERLLKTLLSDGHLSPLEHASFTFAVEGISRACLCQLTRHRMASYTVRSQRHVAAGTTDVVSPFAPGSRARAIFDYVVSQSQRGYRQLLDEGVPKEDARCLLVEGSTTSLVMTANARSLVNFFNLRTCTRAQGEIRSLANSMLALCRSVAPTIFAGPFPDCGRCQKCNK